jgi:hypothetical protein
MPGMNILGTPERYAFGWPPMFNSVERKRYFDLPSGLHRLAGNLRTPIHGLGFLLSAGYFKAAKTFFPTRTFHHTDMEYVLLQLDLMDLRFNFARYSARIRRWHHQQSLKTPVNHQAAGQTPGCVLVLRQGGILL